MFMCDCVCRGTLLTNSALKSSGTYVYLESCIQIRNESRGGGGM